MNEVSFKDGILINGGFLSVGGGILDFCWESGCSIVREGMAIVDTVDAVESGLEELGVPVPTPLAMADPAAKLRAWKSCRMSTDFSCS